MVLVYNPRLERDSLERHFNRIFNSNSSSNNQKYMEDTFIVPAAELIEKEDALLLKIEIPGMKSEDLDIQVMVDRVAISGERKPLEEANNKTKSEFRYGKFQRVIPLPVRIQNTLVSARYKDGILDLTLPKSEAEKNKVVKVNLEK